MRNPKGQFVKGTKPWCTGTVGLVSAWNKGIRNFREDYEHSELTKQKISLGNTGKKFTPEHVEKLRLAKLGRPSGRKGLKFSEEWRKNLSDAHKGNKPNLETRAKMSASQTGRTCWWKGKRGEHSANWKGGRVDSIKILRNSDEFKDWRIKVFQRDNHNCQECGSRKGRTLQAHHIVPIRKDLSKIFDVANGITLCQDCHGKTWWHEDRFEEKYFNILKAKDLTTV